MGHPFTYSDNLIMLTLNRGARDLAVGGRRAARGRSRTTDWVELFNVNGAITARAVVSQPA